LINTSLYTGGEDVAAYAALLFAELGLQEVPAGKSAMLLVFSEDRELRIEVGQAYSADQATAIVQDLVLPAFRDGRTADGIAAGVQGMIGQLVSPAPAVAEQPAAPEPAATEPATADPAASAEGGGNALYWVLGVIAAGIAGIVAMVKRSAAQLAATPCSSCGKTGLTRASVLLAEATEKAAGRGETRTTCPHCGHVDAVPYVIAAKERAAGPDKAGPKGKGGKDTGGGGGGASGSW
jgi:uncharacterized protein